jgi:hypothetical protein
MTRHIKSDYSRIIEENKNSKDRQKSTDQLNVAQNIINNTRQPKYFLFATKRLVDVLGSVLGAVFGSSI